MSGIICDKTVAEKKKGKFYKGVVKSAKFVLKMTKRQDTELEQHRLDDLETKLGRSE